MPLGHGLDIEYQGSRHNSSTHLENVQNLNHDLLSQGSAGLQTWTRYLNVGWAHFPCPYLRRWCLKYLELFLAQSMPWSKWYHLSVAACIGGLGKLQPTAKSGLPPVFGNNFIRTRPHSRISSLSMAAGAQRQKFWEVATETVWNTKPNIFTTGPSQDRSSSDLFHLLDNKNLLSTYCIPDSRLRPGTNKKSLSQKISAWNKYLINPWDMPDIHLLPVPRL